MKLLTLFALLLISRFSYADFWDNLSKQEAEAVVQELKTNPYIFDYCDCCDYSGGNAGTVHLMKVISSEIVECSWDNNYYSVNLEVEYIAEVQNSDNGLINTKLSKSGEITETSFSMNYTWGLNVISKKATPFFDIIPYKTYGENPKPCQKEFKYPSPSLVGAVSKDVGYEIWYNTHVK